ncbi:hypothetical protein PCASD_03052 [Puccinia coronata f. sp. avenae]|uniref:Uncharacterized protein n=2 Tax=Puccinia coronata f. sp. avenae TaxID=200324 RepID=A0A2N5VGJ4_9BASI|nr:hypothetical protein PCASD_26571 [Puccinia coronata f. sp. avenae]PLW49107.1 hypothetical protein PCASD_03052 [Puccinia coronata f. sp. avenae]
MGIIKAYIENLVRWAQIKRAWSLLTHLDFRPSVNLSLQARPIGGKFFKRFNQIKIKFTLFANQSWTPNNSAYASLLSIYLILDCPDLALVLDSRSIHVHKFVQCMALIICAKASMAACQQPQ